MATFPNPRDVGVIAETEAEVARVATYVLTLLKAVCDAVLSGSADGDRLATFPKPIDVGVIVVERFCNVLTKEVLLPPYKKSLLLTVP